jgi:hypothetical protein
MLEDMSDETARNAIEILQFLPFMHFDGIPEKILKRAWENMQNRQLTRWTQSHQLPMLREEHWEPGLARKAMVLLSHFSLVSIDSENNHISMHPLVHTWARDRLVKVGQERYWMIAASTLAMSIPWKFQSSDYNFRRFPLLHIDSCLDSRSSELFTTGEGEEERFEIAAI